MNAPATSPRLLPGALLALLVCVLLILAAGCGSDSTPATPRSPEASRKPREAVVDPVAGRPKKGEANGADAEVATADLAKSEVARRIPIPSPDLSVVDSAVREQIRRHDTALATLRQRSDVPPDELATAYGELGMLYHTYQLFDAAEVCYRNAHRLVPRHFRWAYCLGMIYDSRNEPKEAIAPLETAVRLQPNSVPALVNLAETHLSTGNSERAQPLFDRALQEAPSCAVALVGLGKIAAERQDFPEAIRRFEAALVAQPGANAIHYPLAMVYRRLGDLDQAKLHLEQRGDIPAQIDDPLMAELRQLRTGARFYEKHAVAAGKAGQLEMAVNDLRRALEAAPESASAQLNLGTALALMGETEAAIGHYREALRRKPCFARAHYNLAVLLAEQENVREAVEHFQHAIAADPKYFDAHLGLADVLAQSGRCELAVSHYVRAIEIDPRHRVARMRHARSLRLAGRYTDARAALEEACEILPESMILTHAFAHLLATCPDASQRDGRRALQLAKAVFQTRKSIEHAETVAMAYAETGDYEQAQSLAKPGDYGRHAVCRRSISYPDCARS